MILAKIIKCSIFSVLFLFCLLLRIRASFLNPKTIRLGRSRRRAPKEASFNLIPFQHPSLNESRENFIGVRTHHQATGLQIYGAVDDIWVEANKVLYVVDYKATSKEGDVSIETGWGVSYKRQVEVYQWLLRQNGFEVSNTAYFLYTNGIKGDGHFNDRLNFTTKLIPYEGNDAWIEPVLLEINELLKSQVPPVATKDCKQCEYLDKAFNLFQAISATI